MSLLRAVQRVQNAAAKPSGLCHQYLQAYAEHKGTPSLGEIAVVLDHLRKDRQTLLKETKDRRSTARSQKALRSWVVECEKHEGYVKLRDHIFEQGEELSTTSPTLLSRIYNNIRRINMHGDAERLWPFVDKQIAKGKMEMPDLLRVWSAVPREKLHALDSKLAKALRSAPKVDEMPLQSALSRAEELASNSQVLQVSARLATKRLEDFTSESLSKLLPLLHKALQKGAQFDPIVLTHMKQELVKRGGTLETPAICALLPVIDTVEDDLWKLLRGQLETKGRDLSLQNILDLLEFLRRAAASRKKGEQRLTGFLVLRMKSILSTGFPDPQQVAAVTRRLEVVSSYEPICMALLNAGINMRQDLYPTVLWNLFTQAGEQGLGGLHSNLKPRFERIGEILESHGVQKDRMPMKEMLMAARAMRANGVTMSHCAQQISEHFLDLLRKAEANATAATHDAAGATSEPGPGEADEGEAGEAAEKAAGEEHSQAEAVQETLEAVESDAHALLLASPSELLAKVQRFVLLLLAELQRQGLASAELKRAAVSICREEAGNLETRAIMECFAEFAATKDEEVCSELCTLLSQHLRKRLSSIKPDDLFELTEVHPELLSVAFEEIELRLAEQRLSVSAGLASFLRRMLESVGADNVDMLKSLTNKVVPLMTDTARRNACDDPVTYMGVLQAACTCVGILGLEGSSLSQPIRRGLRDFSSEVPGWKPVDTVELVFAIASAYGGKLPFDILAYAWQLAGRDVARSHEESLTTDPKLWAFVLCAQYLSSKTVLASLRLAPHAPALDTSFAFSKEEDVQLPSFSFAKDLESEALVRGLRLALPAALPSEDVAELFQVRGTPYVADFAFERLQTLLVVPRKEHMTAERGKQLSGFGRLMESTLEAMGWRTCWAWPEDWQSLQQPSGDAVEALRAAIEGSVHDPADADETKTDVADVEGSEEPQPRALEAEASPEVKPSSEEVTSKDAEPQAAVQQKQRMLRDDLAQKMRCAPKGIGNSRLNRIDEYLALIAQELRRIWTEVLPTVQAESLPLIVRELEAKHGYITADPAQPTQTTQACILLDVFQAKATNNAAPALQLDVGSLAGPHAVCNFRAFWAKGRGSALDWVPKELRLCDLYHVLLIEDEYILDSFARAPPVCRIFPVDPHEAAELPFVRLPWAPGEPLPDLSGI
ncbi:unnamed protein product, partial [Symbiodinium microadriaticum]